MVLDLRLPLDTGWSHVSSEFGPRKSVKLPNGSWSSAFHNGIDMARPVGTPIYAPADGVVIQSGPNGGYGEYIGLRFKESGPRLSASFSHMLKGSRTVKAGDRVSKGQLIGKIGLTGNTNGAHLHFECYVDGSPINPRTFYEKYSGGGQLAPTQRKTVGLPANRRIGSASSQAPAGEQLPANTIGNFKGFVVGESVQGNNIWFVGISGDFFWSGGFVGGANTAGLVDLTPAQTMAPHARRVLADLNGRSEPYTYAPVVQTLEADAIAEFDGWKHGESISGETRWVRGKFNKNWFSLLYLEPRNVDGLQDLNTSVDIPVENPKTEEMVTPKMVQPTAADFPSWIAYDEVRDPDILKPTWNLDAQAYYKDTPYSPIESHTHWWGEPGKSGSHDGNVNHLKTTTNLSANFVTSAGRVTMMVPLEKNAFTTGQRNPFGWKSENDPLLTDLGYLTLGYLHYIVEKLNPSLRNEAIRLHKEFQSTSCSEIKVDRVREIADHFHNGVLDPLTGKPKAPGTVEISRDLYDMLKALPAEFRSLANDVERLTP